MSAETPKASLSEKIVDLMFLKRAFEDSPLTERYLSEEFKTSRTPIRDALKTLENDDLIERRKKKGVFLKKPTPKMIADLYDLRIVMEGYAVRLAAENASAADIEKLEEIAADFARNQELGDYVQSEKANITFHTKIIALSGNHMLIGMMKNINIIRKAFQYAYSLRPERQAVPSPCSHEDILQKMREGDFAVCESLMRKHILVGKQRMLEQALGFKIGE